ncbi:MAG: hypothetical protein GY820_25245, partial [Gammaproteobacteria bacterium]|nr:hypothetical protein [Gammaproteobacteria bacterium]
SYIDLSGTGLQAKGLFFDAIVRLEQFGAGNGGDDTYAFYNAIAFQQATGFELAYNSTLHLSNIDLNGINKLIAKAGPGGVLDFDLVDSGTAFRIGFDTESGGSQIIIWDNFSIQDSRDISLADILFHFESGPTLQSPSQTSYGLTVNGGQIQKYNNQSGVARYLENVSHVSFNDWFDAYELGCDVALHIETSIAINTGVFNFNDCGFRSKGRPVIITANSELIDTVNFFGGFIGNDVQTQARENILIEGTNVVANFNVFGTHFECRDETETSSIRVTGKLNGYNIHGHFSGGTELKQTKHMLYFDEGSTSKGGQLSGEFLRFKNKADDGALVHFENDVVTDSNQPLVIPTYFLNTTNPLLLDVETGGNEDAIKQSFIAPPIAGDGIRIGHGKDDVYELEDSVTPSIKGGEVFEITTARASGN